MFHLISTNMRVTQEQSHIPFKMVSFSCFLQRSFLPSQSLSSLSEVSLAKILLQLSLDTQLFTCTHMWSFKHFHYKHCLHRKHICTRVSEPGGLTVIPAPVTLGKLSHSFHTSSFHTWMYPPMKCISKNCCVNIREGHEISPGSS